MFECQRRMIFAGTFNQTFWMLNVKYRLLKPWFCIVYPFVPHEGSKLHGQSLILIAKHIEFSCWLARLASIPFCRKALKNLSSHPNLTSIIFHYLQATYLVSWLLTYKSSWITYAKFRIDVYRVLIESRINGHHRWICFMDVWWFVYIFPLQAQQIKLLYIQSIMTHPRPNQRGWF